MLQFRKLTKSQNFFPDLENQNLGSKNLKKFAMFLKLFITKNSKIIFYNNSKIIKNGALMKIVKKSVEMIKKSSVFNNIPEIKNTAVKY